MAEETSPPEQIKVSIVTPLIYLGIMISAFLIFSVVYRRRRVQKLTKVEPIFGDNLPATLYGFLKQQYVDPNLSKENKPHEKVMKAALLRRAVEAIRRSLKLKENEAIFNKLYQDGLIGDEVFQQYAIQTKLQELELKEIVEETNVYKKNWAQTFFPVAQEICFNEALRRRLYAMDERSKSLGILWEIYVNKSEGKKPEVETEKSETVKLNQEQTPKEKAIAAKASQATPNANSSATTENSPAVA